MGIRLYLIDPETGEPVGALQDGDRIVRAASVEAYRRVEGNTVRVPDEEVPWGMDGFVKVNTREILLWLPKLTAIERQMLFSILPYVQYTSCAIVSGNNEPVDYDGLERISGMSRATVFNAVKLLKQKNILSVVKNSRTQFYICPWIVARGGTINKTLRTMFREYQVQSAGGKRWREMQ